jgi:hypothetical protein
MFQCTWYDPGLGEEDRDDVPFDFALGASFAGINPSNKAFRAAWRTDVINHRAKLLYKKKILEEGIPPKTPSDVTTGSLWGNCAETYPFAILFRYAPITREIRTRY